MQTLAMEEPPGSRLFIVCGRSVEEDTLKAAFLPFGHVQNIKLIKEKGVCYVKYDKASSAALAMESLNGAVLNNGRGPKLKVLLAEAPTPRGVQQPPKLLLAEEQGPSDPDNVPPRSRLFLVVPKSADARLIQDELSRYPDLEYCKTDLISSKGVVFVKYAKSSSALQALEDVAAKSMLGPYKVKVMLAEPKTKRQRPELAMGLFGPVGALSHLPPLGLDAASAMRLSPASQFGAFGLPGAASAASVLAAQQAALGAAAAAAGGPGCDYAPLQGFMGFGGAAGSLAAAAVAAAAAAGAAGGGAGGMELGGQMGLGFGLGPGPLVPPLSTPDAGGMGGAGVAGHLGHAGAPGGSSSGSSGPFQSSPANTGSMGSVSSSLTNVSFPLAPFMGLGPGVAGHGGVHSITMGQMAAAAAAAQQGFAAAAAAAAAASATHDAALGGGGGGGPPVSQQRLFAVVHKSVTDEQLRLLFRHYPGMEYCDVKRDKATGKSKGFCYVNYSTPAAAAAAVADLNGVEFPAGSGFRIKVMFAEIMPGGAAAAAAAAGGGGGAGGGGSSGGGAAAAAAAAALLRSSSSRGSLRTPSSGHLGSLVRVGSGPLSHQHSSSSAGTLGGAGQLGGQLRGVGSGGGGGSGAGAAGAGPGGGGAVLPGPSPGAVGAGPGGAAVAAGAGAPGGMGSRGPSPSATPPGGRGISGELAHVAESLGSMSLPSMGGGGPAPAMGSIGGDPSSDAAAVAAAAAAAAAAHGQRYGDLGGGGMGGGSGLGSSVARELMFNVG